MVNNNDPLYKSSNADSEKSASKSNGLAVDLLDVKIIKELLADPDIQSVALAKKLGKPLSTIQRRKNDLEKSSILRKNYELSVESLGWRIAEILMLVEKGRADHMAHELIEKFDRVIGTSIRLNTQYNLAAYVGYRDSGELHEQMETIRRMPYVNNIEWSEIVKDLGNKNHRLAHLVFNSSK